MGVKQQSVTRQFSQALAALQTQICADAIASGQETVINAVRQNHGDRELVRCLKEYRDAVDELTIQWAARGGVARDIAIAVSRGNR